MGCHIRVQCMPPDVVGADRERHFRLAAHGLAPGRLQLRSISEISLVFGPKPWHIEIRHRVKQTYTINLFGFEILKLKIQD